MENQTQSLQSAQEQSYDSGHSQHPFDQQAMGSSMPPPAFQLKTAEGPAIQRALRPGDDVDAAVDPRFAGHAAQRAIWGMAPAGTAGDGSTVAHLDDGNGHTYWGRNGHGRALPPGMVANAISRTHAEGDVFIQAFLAGGIGGHAILTVDRAACGACGRNGGIKGMARSVGFTSLQMETTLDSDGDYIDPL